MTLPDPLPRFTFICGPICCGKSTVCQQLAEKYSTATMEPIVTHVIVSDIVKILIAGKTDRRDLADTIHLAPLIAERLQSRVQSVASRSRRWLFDGVRQRDVIDHFFHYSDTNITDAHFIWHDPGYAERKMRYSLRSATKDMIPFERAEELDDKLGINQLRDWIVGSHSGF